MDKSDTIPVHRRRFLSLTGAGLVAAVAGCSNSETDNQTDESATPTGTATPATTPEPTATGTPTPELLDGPPEALVLEMADLRGDGWSVIENSGSGDDSVSSHTREFRRETSKGTIERITNQVEVHDSVSGASNAYEQFEYEGYYGLSPGTTESLSVGAESEWARGQRDPNQYTNHIRVQDVNVAGFVAWHQVNNQEEYTAVDRPEIEPLAETMHEKWR